MYPTIFGFIDSYVLMIIIGVILALLVFFLYLRKNKATRNEILDLLFVGIVAVFFGVIFACLFENLYEFIEDPKHYKFTFGLTFIGGVVGGAGTFILMYFLYYLKRHQPIMKNILVIAPASITLAHAIGRIGCFLDGCCYGKETTSWIGVKFPNLPNPVIPTQLIESGFLFILCGILMFLAFKFSFRYTMPIYIISYSIFRFVVEFYRGDERGAFIGIFSPSQIWCMVLFVFGIGLIFIYKYFIFKEKENVEESNN